MKERDLPRGVYRHVKKYKDKTHSYFVAQIKLSDKKNGVRKTVHLGQFISPEKAHEAFKKAVFYYHGK